MESKKLNTDMQKKMQKELELYLNEKKSFKDYFSSMKESSAWLQKKAKH